MHCKYLIYGKRLPGKSSIMRKYLKMCYVQMKRKTQKNCAQGIFILSCIGLPDELSQFIIKKYVLCDLSNNIANLLF